eukprot:g3096.t1
MEAYAANRDGGIGANGMRVEAESSWLNASDGSGGGSTAGRRLGDGKMQYGSKGEFKPIRIATFFVEKLFAPDMDPAMKAFVTQDLLPSATDYWKKALEVVPVRGNFRVPRLCTSHWNTADRPCARVQQNQKCGGSHDPYTPTVPAQHLDYLKYCPDNNALRSGKCKEAKGGRGIPDTDYVLYVTAFQTPHCGHSSETQTLAYAAQCGRDQFDRPVVGYTNFCPKMLSIASKDWDEQLSTAVHEIGHALGFAADSLAYFRAPDGTPLTPRDNTGLPEMRTFDCPGAAGRRRLRLPACAGPGCGSVPKWPVLKFATERGVRVVKVVTPHVKRVVREFFNCSTLDGAELENQHTSARACFGSHWEERLFNTDLMSPVSSKFTVYSALTLAFLEDSGWYKGNYDASQPALWGYHRGCSFATDKCIAGPKTAPKPRFPEFCTKERQAGCTPDRTHQGYCGLHRRKFALPAPYQYFSDPSLGGGLEQVDFCPYWRGYSNRDCRDLAQQQKDERNWGGQIFHAASRCLESTLSQKTPLNGMQGSLDNKIGCYKVECFGDPDVPSSLSVKITATVVSQQGRRGEIKTRPGYAICRMDDAGKSTSITGMQGSVTCPDPRPLCINMRCPDACSGRGACVGETCQCAAGYTGSNCAFQQCPDDCSGHGDCGADLRCYCKGDWAGLACDHICKGDNCTRNEPHTCENGQKWAWCGIACVKTCSKPSPLCRGNCVPRCQCPDSRPLWDAKGKKCITKAECPVKYVYIKTKIKTLLEIGHFTSAARKTFTRTLAKIIGATNDDIVVLNVGEVMDDGTDQSNITDGGGGTFTGRRRLADEKSVTEITFQVRSLEVDAVSREAAVLHAIASGKWIAAARNARPATFGGVSFEFVSVEETTYDSNDDFSAYTPAQPEWKNVVKNIGAPLVLPIAIAGTVLLCCCCAVSCVIQKRNERFDKYVEKLRLKLRVAKRTQGNAAAESDSERAGMLQTERYRSTFDDNDLGADDGARDDYDPDAYDPNEDIFNFHKPTGGEASSAGGSGGGGGGGVRL